MYLFSIEIFWVWSSGILNILLVNIYWGLMTKKWCDNVLQTWSHFIFVNTQSTHYFYFLHFTDEQNSNTPGELDYSTFPSWRPSRKLDAYALVSLSPSSTLCCFPHKAASKIKYVLNCKLQLVRKDFLLGITFHLQCTDLAPWSICGGEKKGSF